MSDATSPLAGTEVHSLRSEHVGDDFKIFVGHCGRSTDRALPVLYLTDANGFFGATVDAVRSMQLSRLLPPLLVVGIGYPRGTLADTVDLRARDLTPTTDDAFARVYPSDTGTGGASRFLAFIRDELMPWVASNYRIDAHDATYFGHSLGGLFGTYAMLTEPTTFTRYIVASPSYWWDRETIFRLEDEYAATNDDLPARAFFGIGADEDHAGRITEATNMPDAERAIAQKYSFDMVEQMQRFVARVTSRGYRNLDATTRVFADEFHCTVAPLVLSRGLRSLFDAPA
ncbi:MAG TPA: alpha/beta hydrolase-fold protein [Acidimicrobiia bacterium]|nr:alpha/beta hydrolase-fold protein [Acidimicrobiia bacterium]